MEEKVKSLMSYSEFVSPGHPDKVADYISEYILDCYLERDPDVRYAVEVLIKGNMVVLAGEVTSTIWFTDSEYRDFVVKALGEIGYTEEYYKIWGDNVINPNELKVVVNISAQSPEISQGVNASGWGDQGIFFGYAFPDGDETMMPLSHAYAKWLCHDLYMKAKNEGIGGLDIKTEILMDGDVIKKIVAAVPCRNDVEYQKVRLAINIWYASLTNQPKEYPEIILNGTGSYQMHGPVADSGITGRKLAVDFYGGCGQIGGGSPWTKDASKADLSLNLMAREMAVIYAKTKNVPVKVELACCIGKSVVDYQITEPCGGILKTGQVDVTPRELKNRFGLDKPIFTSMCTFGLFGKFQKDKKWENNE